MKNLILLLGFIFLTFTSYSQGLNVSVVSDANGMKLEVDGKDVMINGINWDYFPIGTNYSYSLWNQPDDLVRAALDSEMSLLQNMGVNVIRVYTGIQPKWIEYIYDNYGIYTMLNHSFGRYGLTINGAWEAVTDYRKQGVRDLLLSEATELASVYKDTRGLLLFLLGNENNYGLFWAGAETEDFPDDEQEKAFIGEQRGRPMYKLMNDAAVAMKSIDSNHPVAICNGDVLFIDIVADECKDVDIYGVNAYRGVSFGDIFDVVKQKLNKPVLFTEFGADSYNAITSAEDQRSQAYYMVENWKEIYENAYGLGKAGNSIGGFTFQFSDGWWKYGQTKNLDIHDNHASWANGGYFIDFEEGENNMNEEWFGICAKGQTNERGTYQLYPRAAYYALKEAHSFNPLASGTSLQDVQKHFAGIALMDAVIKARGDKAALNGERAKKIRISELRAEISTFSTGGSLISTPDDPVAGAQNYPDQLGFDHMESYYIGVEANPSENVRAEISFNVLGNVATNPINEIFYENRGRAQILNTRSSGTVTQGDVNRLQVYQGEISWKSKYLDVDGFYRTGHYHWGYEGDFFGLYPEANYGPNIDLYNGEAPFGFELTGKRGLDGFKLAFGPELWWGANPAVLLKYSTHLGKWKATGIYHEDIDNAGASVSSFAIPQPVTRRASIHLERDFGKFGFEIGGLWGGDPLVGREFQLMNEDDESDNTIYKDIIRSSDTWGGKVKLTYQGGRFNWYAQGTARGLVAFGGADGTQTFTGWKLKDHGSGNVAQLLSGFTYTMGNFQFAPNFMYQKPIVGPMVGVLNEDGDYIFNGPGRSRNIIDDPFVVRANREATAGEILITYDPTPGTWMYEWDNDRAEDASFALSAGFVYRSFPTSQDAAIGILPDGRTLFPFPGAPPAEDLWEVHTRIVSKASKRFGFVTNLYVGNAQANGSDPRLIERFGGDIRMIYDNFKFTAMAKVDDWGPYDYHRDFNLTYPLQLSADLSTSISKGSWFNLPSTRMGVTYTWRSLNQYSPRYCPTTTIGPDGTPECDMMATGFDNGREWEFRTYFHVNISN